MPPFTLLVVAPRRGRPPADRRPARAAPAQVDMRVATVERRRSSPWRRARHDAVAARRRARRRRRPSAALLEEDPRAQVILLGDPSGAEAVRAARASPGRSTTCPRTGLDADDARARRPLRRRSPALGRAARARRAARRADRAAEPHALPRPARAVAAAGAPAGPGQRRARCSSSTSTASRSSTTRSATRPATGCCRRSRSRLDAALRPGRHRRPHRRRRVHRAARGRHRPARGDRRRRARARDAGRAVPRSPGASCSSPARSASRSAAPDADPEAAHPRRRRRDVPRQGRGQGAPRGVRRRACTARCSSAWTSRPTCGGRSSARPCRSSSSPIVRTAHGARSRASRRSAAGRSSRTSSSTMAEETGLIVPLGRFVLREAARRAARVGRPGLGQRLRAPARRSRLRRLGRGGAAGGRAPGAEPAAGGDGVRDVAGSRGRPCGRCATCATGSASRAHLDDFGTGASSLRFLHRFPGGALKIDPGLVIDMLDRRRRPHEIVKAVVGLAHALGMEVVGEGVETAAHLRAARRALGCESVQGFHLSPPLTGRGRRTAHGARAAEPGSAALRSRWASGSALGVADVVRDPLALEAALVLAALLVLGRRAAAPAEWAPSSSRARRGRMRSSTVWPSPSRSLGCRDVGELVALVVGDRARGRPCRGRASRPAPDGRSPRPAPSRRSAAPCAPCARRPRRGSRAVRRRSGARRRQPRGVSAAHARPACGEQWRACAAAARAARG